MKRPFLRTARPVAIALAVLLVATASSAWDKSSGPPPGAKPAQDAAAAPKAAPVPKRIDINSASATELQTLPGIGETESKRIIAARPYPSKAKLVAEEVLSFEVFAGIKDRIVAVQKQVPKAQAAAKPAGKS